tara:strand:+ start:518 stop:988 length:471 start_codon:yes stop_codon:yes gene_type:complete
MTKQEEYDTLSESLDFFEMKVKMSEDEFDLLLRECQIYNYKILADKIDDLEGEGVLTEDDEEKAEKLKAYLKGVDIPNKEDLIVAVNITYRGLKGLYLKQLKTIAELKKFTEAEKFNSEVKITLHNEFLDPFQEVTEQIMDARRRMKNKMLEMIEK